jgi:hypothetical protein
MRVRLPPSALSKYLKTRRGFFFFPHCEIAVPSANGRGLNPRTGLAGTTGHEAIVASPATLQKAKEKGLLITEPPRLSDEDAISKLFDERKQYALSVASTLRLCPVPDTSVLYLYDQIRLCLLFNLNGAAITFAGILVEYALKYATYVRENPDATSFDTSAWRSLKSLH